MSIGRIWGKRCVRGAGALLGLWALSQLAYRATRAALPSRPFLIAHRGFPALAPENTLAAFDQAERWGADLLETDVRQTRDGVLVLMHDATLKRTTQAAGSVEKASAQELARLRARGEPIPTFDQFLELASQGRADLLPEAKGHTPGLEYAMVKALQDHGLIERTRVQSFSTDSLERLHAARPDLKLLRLYYPWGLWVGANPPGVSVVSPMAETLLLNPWMVRQAHRRGYQVWPWFAGLESAFTVRWVLSLGVDGLMINDPRHWPR